MIILTIPVCSRFLCQKLSTKSYIKMRLYFLHKTLRHNTANFYRGANLWYFITHSWSLIAQFSKGKLDLLHLCDSYSNLVQIVVSMVVCSLCKTLRVEFSYKIIKPDTLCKLLKFKILCKKEGISNSCKTMGHFQSPSGTCTSPSYSTC